MTALAIVALAVAALLLARRVESGMIFFPAPYPQGVWEPERAGAEEVSFRTDDGLTLYGWWFPARGASGRTETGETATGRAATGEDATGRGPVLLWAHGNGGNVTGRAFHAAELARNGLSVLVFDYRGYGKSEGSPDEAGIYRDAEAAYAFLTGALDVAAPRIILYGRSLGSAPAARLSTRVPHAGVVLVSPLPSAKRMARRMFGGLPVDLLIRARFPVVEWVAQRRTPLLVIHGDRDEIIPVRYGREVFEAAAEPKQWLELAGTGHNNILTVAGRAYLVPLLAFAFSAVEQARCPGGAC